MAAADSRPVSCSQVARFLSCKQRPSCAIEGTLPIGISWLAPTVNHCSAHETWSHAVVRCSTTHHCHYGLLPLPVAPSQDAEMARPKQVPFRFAPTTRPGPLLLKNSHSRSSQKFHRARMPYKRRSRFWWTFSTPRLGQFVQKRGFFSRHRRLHPRIQKWSFMHASGNSDARQATPGLLISPDFAADPHPALFSPSCNTRTTAWAQFPEVVKAVRVHAERR